MFILWYSASSTFGKDSDIVMGAKQQKKPAVRWWKPHLASEGVNAASPAEFCSSGA